jgi:hypothetical protein
VAQHEQVGADFRRFQYKPHGLKPYPTEQKLRSPKLSIFLDGKPVSLLTCQQYKNRLHSAAFARDFPILNERSTWSGAPCKLLPAEPLSQLSS